MPKFLVQSASKSSPQPVPQSLRVALVTENFYPTVGGIQEHIYFFAKLLLKWGHRPLIVTPHVRDGGAFETWWPKDLPPDIYHAVGTSMPFFINQSKSRTSAGLFMGGQLRKLLRPANVDIVHLHAPLNGALPILANHFATVPVIGTFHTYFTGKKGLTIMHRLGQRHIDRLSHVIAVAPLAEQSMRRIFDFEASIIPNGISCETFHPLGMDGTPDDRLPQYVDDKINILFVGRPDPRNGLNVIIDAFANLQRAGLKVRLLVVGGGELIGPYRRQVSERGIQDVEFLGKIVDERPQIYRTAHIQVVHVERASFGMALIEGMASGLPVVTTNFPGYDFAGQSGKHFATVHWGNVGELTQTLTELVTHPEAREKYRGPARARALNFDWPTVGREIVDIYKRVLEAESAAASAAAKPVRKRIPVRGPGRIIVSPIV